MQINEIEESLIDAALDCDVNYMIKLYKNEVVDLDPKNISVPYSALNNLNNHTHLYNLIVNKLTHLGYGNELLEMMPIIDDYLEIYS